MAKKMKEDERPDEEVLPDEYTITLGLSGKEVKIKPWSWGVWNKVAPHVEEIFNVVEVSNINVGALGEMLAVQNKLQDKIISANPLTEDEKKLYTNTAAKANTVISQLLIKAGRFVSPILELSTDLTEEEIDNLNPNDIYMLAFHIYHLNPTVLGNVYMPFEEESPERQKRKKKS